MQIPLVHANGAAIPALGLGTMKLNGDVAIQSIHAALQAGYRHFDTAKRYENEADVGEAIRTGGVSRSEIFVTTKIWWDNIADGELQPAAEAGLKRLGMDYVDLLLIHWPNPAIPLAASIKALCEVRVRGLARHIGVANFPVALIEEAWAATSEPLVTNQCEYHPQLDQSKVLAACRKHGMSFTSYSPIGQGSFQNIAVLDQLAAKYGKTTAQILLRWHIQQPGVIAIPRSSNPARIAENIDIFDFTLTEAEMAALFALAKPDGRMIRPTFEPNWDRA